MVVTCRAIQEKQSLSVRESAKDDSCFTSHLPSASMLLGTSTPKNQVIQEDKSLEGPERFNQEAGVVVHQNERKSMLTQDPGMVVETDAFMLRWGAVCKGVRTGGL